MRKLVPTLLNLFTTSRCATVISIAVTIVFYLFSLSGDAGAYSYLYLLCSLVILFITLISGIRARVDKEVVKIIADGGRGKDSQLLAHGFDTNKTGRVVFFYLSLLGFAISSGFLINNLVRLRYHPPEVRNEIRDELLSAQNKLDSISARQDSIFILLRNQELNCSKTVPATVKKENNCVHNKKKRG